MVQGCTPKGAQKLGFLVELSGWEGAAGVKIESGGI
jgi:hypothetical protein